jgi:hypothetical protein
MAAWPQTAKAADGSRAAEGSMAAIGPPARLQRRPYCSQQPGGNRRGSETADYSRATYGITADEGGRAACHPKGMGSGAAYRHNSLQIAA